MPNEPYVEQIMVADGDGDNPDVEEVKYETIHDGGGGTNLDSLPDSTNDISDTDLIVSKENDSWVKKTALKIWNYVKTKLGISDEGSTEKYLNEKGNFTTLAQTMLDICYPVGSIYTSTKNISPATFLGGTWKSLNGYMLRGATSGVTFNNNAKDGGADSVSVSSVASHNHTQDSHNHTQDAHSHSITSETALWVGYMDQHVNHTHRIAEEYGTAGNVSYPPNDTYAMIAGIHAGTKAWHSSSVSDENVNHQHQVNAHDHFQNTGGKTATNQAKTATNQAKGATYSISTLPNYKNVYMWERTA